MESGNSGAGEHTRVEGKPALVKRGNPFMPRKFNCQLGWGIAPEAYCDGRNVCAPPKAILHQLLCRLNMLARAGGGTNWGTLSGNACRNKACCKVVKCPRGPLVKIRWV